MGINRNLSDLSRSVNRKEEHKKLLAILLVGTIVLALAIVLIVNRKAIFDLRDNTYTNFYFDEPVRIHIVTDEEVGVYDNYDADELVVACYSDGDDYSITTDGNDVYITYTGKKPMFASDWKDEVYLDIGANVVIESMDIVSGREVYFNKVKTGKTSVETAERIYVRNCTFDELNVVSNGDPADYQYNYIDAVECGTMNISSSIETDLCDCSIASLNMNLDIDDRFARSDIENCAIGLINITSNSEISLSLIGSEADYEGKISINTTAKHPISYSDTLEENIDLNVSGDASADSEE